MESLEDIAGIDWSKALPKGRNPNETRRMVLYEIRRGIKGRWGFLRNLTKTEDEVIQIIMSTRITNDTEAAKKVIRYLENTNYVHYSDGSGDISLCNDGYYNLKRVQDRKENIRFKILDLHLPTHWD